MADWPEQLIPLVEAIRTGDHPDLCSQGHVTALGSVFLPLDDDRRAFGCEVHRYDGMHPDRDALPAPRRRRYPSPVLWTLAMLVDELSLLLSPTPVAHLFDATRGLVRELLVNAVVHRDYAIEADIEVHVFTDAVEIRSPGAPRCELGRDGFVGHTSGNPVLHAYLRRVGLATASGRGWAQAWAHGRQLGIHLQVEGDTDTRVLLTLDAQRQALLAVEAPRKREVRRPLTETERLVLGALSDTTWRTPKELEAMTGCARSSLNRALKELVARGEIEPSSLSRNSPTQSYRRRR